MFDTAKRCGEDLPLGEVRWCGAWLCCARAVYGWWTGAVTGECGTAMHRPSYDGPLLDAAIAAEADLLDWSAAEELMDETTVVSVRICRYCCDDDAD